MEGGVRLEERSIDETEGMMSPFYIFLDCDSVRG